MLRGSKGRSRGGFRGGDDSRGGRGWNRSRGHDMGVHGGKAIEGRNDLKSLCAGAGSEPMVSTPGRSRGVSVGSKGRGAFVSTVGLKSFRVDSSNKLSCDNGNSEAKAALKTVDVHDVRTYPASKQSNKKGRQKGTLETQHLVDRNKECPSAGSKGKPKLEKSCKNRISPKMNELTTLDASKADDASLRHMDHLKIVTDDMEVENSMKNYAAAAKGSSSGPLPEDLEQERSPASKYPGSNYTSQATGLKVLSVTSSSTEYNFTPNDRARLVKNIPGVVIINSAGKGDSLLLGVDIDYVKLVKLISNIEMDPFRISLVETTERDPFSYFADWNVIPRVDKGGMFQLIVSLRGQGQVRRRNQLLDLVKSFNISKVVHGEGETILLVGHVLEFVAYSDCIRKLFTMERRHTWQPKPSTNNNYSHHNPTQERYFLIKVKNPEMGTLSTAHKQYSVHHELSRAGEVIQLEDQLLGVVDHYLAVIKNVADMKDLGEQFDVLEIWPDSLPDKYIPTYGVDGWGFYSVSGKFPEDVDPKMRNSFAEDMKTLGAVGFRTGETENSFSLHFVNSRCIEQMSRCAQYTSFRLTILSSLVRKPGLDKKLRRLVPAILKHKELEVSENINSALKEGLNPDLKMAGEQTMQKIPSNNNLEQEDYKIVAQVESQKSHPPQEDKKGACQIIEAVKNKDISEKHKVNETPGKTKMNAAERKHGSPKEKTGKSIKKSKKELKEVADTLKSDFVLIDETTVLKIASKESASISSHINCLCKFFTMIKDVVVTEDEDCGKVVFKFPSKKNVDKVLGILCNEEANTVDKMEHIPNKLIMDGSKFFENKFGLVINMEKNSSLENLEKDFANHGPLEVETRGHVFVVWFDSKLSLFKALTDRRIQKFKMVPSVQNFNFCNPVAKNKETPVTKSKETKLDEGKVLKLTEREVFGFLWQRQKSQARIRDDQVISRLLTNFIKKVSCEELTVDEEGLSVTFSTSDQYRAALAQFCPSPVPDRSQLAALARKFTLLPAKGSYGLFSIKRIKPEHFNIFKDCIVRNSVIWFNDKLSMFKVLREPFVTKLYPALFIDCRNIFILSSKNMLAVGKPVPVVDEKQNTSLVKKSPTMNKLPIIQRSVTRSPLAIAKPSKPSSVKTKLNQQDQVFQRKQDSGMQGCSDQGVLTRAASSKFSECKSSPVQSSEPLCQTPIPHDAKITSSSISVNPDVATGTKLADTAIVTAVTPSSIKQTRSSAPCPLIADLFKMYDGGHSGGKFGHIPSARLVRTGYKQCRVPIITRSKVAQEDLFLENKECYRGKDVTEAAGIIKDILHGKGETVEGDTLREIKMKRVESFLRGKLRVVSGSELPGNKVQDTFTKLREPGIKEGNKKVVNSSSLEKNNVVGDEKSSVEVNNNAVEEQTAEEAGTEQGNSKIVEEDVGLTNDSIGSSRVENLEKAKLSAVAHISEDVNDEAVVKSKACVKEVPILTPDVLGLFTLMLSVPLNQDVTFFTELEENISWFDTPVSIKCVNEGNTMIEVKMRDQDMAMAVLNGLKQKYPGLKGDTTDSHADIFPDKKTGLYTLCFTDIMMKRYKATMDKFQKYSKKTPVIRKGFGKDQVLVGYEDKNAAIEALRDNIDSTEFPKLHIAPASRA